MPKKCFIASVEIDMLVFAEDEEEAREVASKHLGDEVSNLSDGDFTVMPATYYPPGWDATCCVYQVTGESDLRAKHALEATPEFAEAMKRHTDMAGAKTPKA